MIDFNLQSGGKLVFIRPGVWTVVGPNTEHVDLRGEAILDEDGEPKGECYYVSMVAGADLRRIGKTRDSLVGDLKYLAKLAGEQVEFR